MSYKKTASAAPTLLKITSLHPFEEHPYKVQDNAEMDALLAEAKAEKDNDKRITLYQQVEEAVVAAAPWIPLFHRKVYYAVQPGVTGWQPALIYNADRFNTVDKQ